MFRPHGLVNQMGQRQTGREILVKEVPISTNMGGRFLEFLVFKTLPSGQQTTLPTLHSDEVAKLSTPYNDWAPPPFNNNANRAEAGAIRFMFNFSGLEDMFDMGAMLSGRFEGMSFLNNDLHFGKTRAWDGFVPISDRRWREKGLDDPENLGKACEHLISVVQSFTYFAGLPETQRKIRDSYNKAYDHLAHFDRALEAYYRQSAAGRPWEGGGTIPKAAHLWTDFFFTHVAFATERVHAWVSERVKALIDPLLEQIRHSSPLPGSQGRTHSPEQMAMLDKLRLLNELWSRADIDIFVPLHGFKNELPQWRHLSSPPITNWAAYNPKTSLSGLYPVDFTVRNSVYTNRMKWVVREHIVQDLMDHHGAVVSGQIQPCSAEAVHKLCVNQINAYAEARQELRGSERMPIRWELWVTNLKQQLEFVPHLEPGQPAVPPAHTKWGYVGYRIFYQHSADQWSAFAEAFKNDAVNWGDGVLGVADIKSKARIRWIDGQTVGIAEGDVQSARRHFYSLKQNRALDFTTVDAFLVADESSIDSYIKYTQRPLLPGQNLVDEPDLGPFIRVGEAERQDSERTQTVDPESPGFDGTVRVLGSAIFDDVWANLFIRSNPLKAYWPIAACHPNFVYTGPMAQYQKRGWNTMGLMKMTLFKKADEWKKEGRLGRSI